MDSHEPAIERETGRPVTCSVIWLHGLGADGHDFEPIVPELRLPATAGVRFVFPHAPYRAVTINGGTVMRAWYDIAATDRGIRQDAAHVRESVARLHELIEQERRRGIASERIVTAGFSQGGAIALHGGLRYERSLAGILSLSAPVPFLDELCDQIHPANAATPVFLAHGRTDRVVPFESAEQARTGLTEHGLRVEWRAYDMDHTVTPVEIRDMARWLRDALKLDHA